MLFVDASNLFEKEKKQNVMNKEHIDRVIKLYNDRKTVDKLSFLASYEDIEKNDFNLNIPRYIDTSEEEEEIDLRELSANLRNIDREIKESNEALMKMFGELTFCDEDIKGAVEEFIKVFGEV